MKDYEARKQEIREKAIKWQAEFSEKKYYESDLAFFSEYFRRKAKQYGLTREFRGNGII